MNINEKKFIGREQAKGDNMLCKDTVRATLQALSDSGLCVCESRIIGNCHPGRIDDNEYIIGRLEESDNVE